MSDGEILVEAEGVSKKFCRELKRSLYYGVKDLFGEVGGHAAHESLRPGEFWAVKDVSFQLRRGEVLGLIGANGAGKSTLLRMLNGLIKPDTGRITVRGRVGALIALGAGFNPILTGRENVYNAGAVLGFTRREINEKYDAIVEFSELEDFMEMPVQNYSSGMVVRLGFSVAAQMEPDVLILDEVLAVGDVGFREKCINRVLEIVRKSAVIFVSHSMFQVGRLSNKILVMQKGTQQYLGEDVGEGIQKYFSFFGSLAEHSSKITLTDKLDVKNIQVLGESFEKPDRFTRNDRICIRVEMQVYEPVTAHFRWIIRNAEHVEFATLSYDRSPGESLEPGKQVLHFLTPPLPLSAGKYLVSMNVFGSKQGGALSRWLDCLELNFGGLVHTKTPVEFSEVTLLKMGNQELDIALHEDA